MSGQWFFEFLMHLTGEDLVGDIASGEKKIQIPLFAKNAEEAEKQAQVAIEQFTAASAREDRSFFEQYWSAIECEDGIAFSDFRIYFEKKFLAMHVPRIVGGP